jgi:hypothetical protein
MAAYTWDELAGLTLRRQFPAVRGTGRKAVVETLRRVGPVQSQVARSPFVTVSSRLPGARYADIVAAHEAYDVVRGSSLRGTVHTCVREQHPLLDTVARRTLHKFWVRGLRLTRVEADDVRQAMEDFATGAWRTPDELRDHLVGWLAEHETDDAVQAATTDGQARSTAHIHSAMIRRPLSGTGWERQSTPGYRVAADALAVPRSAWLDDPDGALVALVRVHLSSYGPANRRDIAWWSGEGLRNVDQALATLADELTERPGPDGQTYYDLADVRARRHDPGVRLLPEFDALVVGYDPKSRDRFVDASHLPYFWLASNGMFSSVVLKDARLVGSWRFTGPEGRRRVEVRSFPGEPSVSAAELGPQVAALETALAITVADVSVARAGE